MEPTPQISPQARVSLRDIAQHLGLNHSTVSRALRNKSRVSKELSTKIQQTAQELGYRPDPMLSALAHYRQGKASQQISSVIGWINCWPNPLDLRRLKEFDCYWQGAARAAEKLGYRLEEFVSNEQIPLTRLDKILRTRHVEGILIPPHPPSFILGEFHWENYSVARLSRRMGYLPHHMVASDQAGNAMLAYDQIRRKGYRRIGFLTGRSSGGGTMFEAGFLMAQSCASDDLEVLPTLILKETDAREDEQQVKQWVKKIKPDAILTDVALAAKLLASAGCRVPEDVGLAALSVLDGNADAGIYQNPEEVGRVAILLVVSLINDGAKGIPPIFRQILISGQWVDGESLPSR